MQHVSRRRHTDLLLLLVILTGGFALRVDGLNQMINMLSYDEAYNGIDALSILQHPRLVPFFPENFGRESAWMYWLLPWLKALGARPFTLRVVAVVTGFLTLGIVYALARELLAKREAVWSAAAVAVLYWHVQLSHIALRAILLPLVAGLAFAMLFRAYRTNRFRWWVSGGALVGLLLYTYLSASLWVGYALLMQGWWLVKDNDRRRGALVSIAVSIILSLPLLTYVLSRPNLALSRVNQVRVFDSQGIIRNLRLWSGAWLVQGSTNSQLNLPGRSILDLPLAVLFVVGLVGCVWAARRRLHPTLWLSGAMLISIFPSAISDQAPHPLRAIGLILPIAMIIGAGARMIESRVAFLGRYALVISLALFAWAAFNTHRDFRSWLEHPNLFVSMEMHVVESADFIASNVPEDTQVYFSPFDAFHPLPRFFSSELAPRPIGAFKSQSCTIVPDARAVYVTLTTWHPAFQDGLSQWADTEILFEGSSVEDFRYEAIQAVPRPEFLALWEGEESIIFADEVEIRFAEPPSEVARVGDVARFTFAMRPLQAMNRLYAIFVHLQSDPSPYEGGPLHNQQDEQLCPSHPTPVWELNETIIQTVQLPIPEDIEPGNYTIAIGLYDNQSGLRLQVTEPVGQQDFFEVHTIDVLAADS